MVEVDLGGDRQRSMGVLLKIHCMHAGHSQRININIVFQSFAQHF